MEFIKLSAPAFYLSAEVFGGDAICFAATKRPDGPIWQRRGSHTYQESLTTTRL
jgi:hypothetical protein